MNNIPHTQAWFLLLYISAIIFWLILWRILKGYNLMTTSVKNLWVPFIANIVILSLNAYFNLSNFYIAPASEEEALFNAITDRLRNVFTAATAVLAISALIYTIRKERASEPFVNFASYTFIFGLVSMFIIWIPGNEAAGKFLLRHFQTIFLCTSISLCMGAVLILLKDISGRINQAQENG